MSDSNIPSSSSSRPAVAYLGPPSSYTNQVTAANFDTQRYDLEPQPSIIDVFHAVRTKSATYGVAPFENSSNGAVLQSLDIFGDKDDRFSDLTVCGEAYLAVHHCLLGFVEGTETGDNKKRVQHVTKIYSHPQAFGQCEAFLSANCKGAERQEVNSTSLAAQMVAEDQKAGRTGTAAIASSMAAELQGLEVLVEGIEDRPDNETRFLVLKQRGNRDDPELKVAHIDAAGACDDHKDWKTLVSFTINHSKTGALGTVLNVFTDCGLNLTSINSRPSRTQPWHYTFFVEFGGRREESGQGNVDRALKKLQEVTEWCRWHGSWRRRGGL